MADIALINYGMGNLHSVAKALERSGGRVRLVDSPDGLAGATRIVLPGVGAFRDCAAALTRTGLGEAIVERINEGTPFLGICLGMQLAVVEFARHVAGITDAGSTEFDAHAPNPVIALMTEWEQQDGERQQREGGAAEQRADGDGPGTVPPAVSCHGRQRDGAQREPEADQRREVL